MPITRLPTLGKVIELVVARKVTRAIEANGLLLDEHPHLAITGFTDDTNLLVFG
jgi:hypothetical protein